LTQHFIISLSQKFRIVYLSSSYEYNYLSSSIFTYIIVIDNGEI
jgi:hypothetical protein